MIEISTARKYFPLLLPFLFGLFLRFYNLDHQGLFLDEAFSADLVAYSWQRMFNLGLQDVHPLLYYAFLKLSLTTLPLNAWTLRFFSALCSTLALGLAIDITRQLVGLRAAILTGWLLAWSSLQLYYAQEARMYTLLELLWLLSPWLLLHAIKQQHWPYWVGWALTTAAAIHTQFYGLLLWAVGAVGSALLLLQQRSWHRLRGWLLAQFIIVAPLTVPLLFLLLTVIRQGTGGVWVPTLVDPLKLWLLGLFGFSPVREQFLNGEALSLEPWSRIPFSIWSILALVIIVGALIGWWRRGIADKSGQAAWLVITFGFLPPLLSAAMLGVLQKQFWAPRPFLGSIAWLLIGVAIGWSAFRRRTAWCIMGVLFALNAGSLWAYETRWIKGYSQIAFSVWDEQVPSNTILLLDRSYKFVLWNFYQPYQEDIPVFGLLPLPDGTMSLWRLEHDGTLRGHARLTSCKELPTSVLIGLYDPGGRRFHEQWPDCLRERPGWSFNPAARQWEAVPQLLP
ncbi:MAG: glycosyltransferase family 39 protein [Chloroflexaceae bacterium]